MIDTVHVGMYYLVWVYSKDDVTCDQVPVTSSHTLYTEPGPIRTLMEEIIKSYILWRLHCLIPINF